VPADGDMINVHSRLPGLAERILKVDHAGEHGAVCIYTGQIHVARVTSPRLVAELQEIRSHERRHRGVFANELRGRGVRRCRSYWLCGVGGYILGAFTALLGTRAIFATTVAVERVVLGHLEDQLEALRDDPAAVAAIASIIADEKQHHDGSLASLGETSLWSRLLMPVVSASTECVIWLGMRL
jgi:ubiquinone biosynthesis monooxygenase Coq7